MTVEVGGGGGGFPGEKQPELEAEHSPQLARRLRMHGELRHISPYASWRDAYAQRSLYLYLLSKT
jgi:hypothetical protein